MRALVIRIPLDFGRGDAFGATARLFSFGGGVPLPELEPPPPPVPAPTPPTPPTPPPPPLVAGRFTVTVAELKLVEPGCNVEAVEGRSLMILEIHSSIVLLGWQNSIVVRRFKVHEYYNSFTAARDQIYNKGPTGKIIPSSFVKRKVNRAACRDFCTRAYRSYIDI